MVTTKPTPSRPRVKPAIIDCDVHNELDSDKDLYPYLSSRWRDHIETFGLRTVAGGYYPRFMDNREDVRPPSGRRSGSEVAVLRETHLERYNVAYAILIPLTRVGRRIRARVRACRRLGRCRS